MEIILEQVEYTYDKKMKKVLDGIDTIFSSGKIIGIIGLNGSGKTTLLELVNGKKLPSNGSIKMNHITISKKGISGNLNSLVGMVPQVPEESILFDTIEKEMLSILESHEYPPEKRQKHILEALALVGLSSDYLLKDPLTLSSGELRKFALACTLSYNPKILLLDEPFIGLDIQDRKLLTSLLITIKTRYHKTILIASNDINFLHKIVDDVIVLSDGKIVLSGSKKEVFQNKDIWESCNIELPNITKFENAALEEKNVHLNQRTEINDLVKDILRSIQ